MFQQFYFQQGKNPLANIQNQDRSFLQKSFYFKIFKQMNKITNISSVGEVPIIDIGAYIRGQSETQEVAQALKKACRDLGFFYIKNHGVSLELQKQIFANMAEFFALPKQEKNKIHISMNNKSGTGYFGFGEEFTNGKLDIKEGIYFSQEFQPNHPRVLKNFPLHGNNFFPEQPLNFKSNILSWMRHMNNIGQALLEGIAQSLGLPRKFLIEEEHKEHLGLMSMFHYPKDIVNNPEIWAVGEHTDYGLLIILMTSDKGLQVKNRKGQWINIDPIEDTYIVNICDTMEKMTKGLYKSTIHRVRNTEGVSRYSIPFFYDPGWDTQIKELDFQISKQEYVIMLRNQEQQRPDKSKLATLEGKYNKYLMKKLSKTLPYLDKYKEFE